MSDARRRGEGPRVRFVQLTVNGVPDGPRCPVRMDRPARLPVSRCGLPAIFVFEHPVGGRHVVGIALDLEVSVGDVIPIMITQSGLITWTAGKPKRVRRR